MLHLVTQASKYLMILLFMVYTFECFHVFRFENRPKRQMAIYSRQRGIMYFIHFDAFLVIYLNTQNVQVIGFYLMQLILFIGIQLVYHLFYKKASELLLNNMLMLLAISLVILTRISFDKALKQFLIMIVSTVLSLLIPIILQKMTSFRRFTWAYALVGIAALSVVLVAGAVSYGAKLSISIAGISIQPSEFVKILYVFFIASMLYQATDMKQLLITSVIAAVHVLILVASKDLGSALLYFVTYLVMIYVATRRLAYFAGGLAACSLAAVAGYKLFSHVRVRVLAWKDPLSMIDKEGYQISQSLFAIGTGGWFGMGLCQGLPNKIPVVAQDFIFSAISEELGGIFALCLIMVCVSCFFMFLNIAMQMKDQFYKLVALGLGTVYAFQVFLTIGGVTKFIPSTGVTLPLVSYGGSSLLSTMILFGIIQGLYIMKSQQAIQPVTKNAEQKAKAKKPAKKKGEEKINGSKKTKAAAKVKVKDLSK
ncbi:FtsW/RodA/SpoVE family cell cycle protein [Roseburia sp. MUC/MUC-530-WT-4D]|uniref:FtsW/RodA/SpoVE family cell cycle protein n=1 Tax=Roseburia porci TaxID=2605790 RepID=A0A6L5YV27_9FIRM|nr:FtsW/RodA/SpoVE family cell cycle protein [Roseburia porci]MST75799.1 FtsW/RodA/SpoVE family cell cycle protein [Roseburia porci]